LFAVYPRRGWDSADALLGFGCRLGPGRLQPEDLPKISIKRGQEIVLYHSARAHSQCIGDGLRFLAVDAGLPEGSNR
jgi:hypothetical protein